jgi:hypothetical protein
MARRSAPPPKPKTPILTVGQKQRRIERLRKCITKLEAFDPQKAHTRAPAILELEAAIDKALSSAFGYGTPAYLRTMRPRHWTRAPFWQMPRSAAPSYVRLVDQQDTMGRLRKRANNFQRTRSDRSPCSGKRSAHLKRKSPMRNQS